MAWSARRRLDVGARRDQAERLEQRRKKVFAVGRAGGPLDDPAEQGVADVGVLEALVAGEHEGVVAGHLEQAGRAREVPVQLPEVAVPAVADDAAGVA